MNKYNDILKKAVEVLRDGGIILYPTDTVWGLGCDAGNNEAVGKIYSIKKSREKRGMLVLLDSASGLPYYVRQVPDIAWQLIDTADSPLTIIYPEVKNISKELVADDGSAGIRIVNDKFCSELIARLRKPLVSTSANITGDPTPGNFSEISEIIKSSADYIIPLRQEEKNIKTASSIIKIWVDGQFKIIRQ